MALAGPSFFRPRGIWWGQGVCGADLAAVLMQLLLQDYAHDAGDPLAAERAAPLPLPEHAGAGYAQPAVAALEQHGVLWFFHAYEARVLARALVRSDGIGIVAKDDHAAYAFCDGFRDCN